MTCVLSPIFNNKHCGFSEETVDYGGYSYIPDRLAECTCRIDSHSTMCRKSVGKTASFVDENKNEVEMKLEFEGIERLKCKRKSDIDSEDLNSFPLKKIPKKSIEYFLEKPATKRISPFLNTPKERKEERRKVLKMTVHKLKSIDDPEHFLRRSVLINNTLKKVQKEIRDEKEKSYQGYKSAIYRSCDIYLQWENQVNSQFNNDDPLTKRLEEETIKLVEDHSNIADNKTDVGDHSNIVDNKTDVGDHSNIADNKTDVGDHSNIADKSDMFETIKDKSSTADIDTVFHSLIRVLDET